ncbi:hypothetical protein PAMA_005299 [Pampus argenteus]
MVHDGGERSVQADDSCCQDGQTLRADGRLSLLANKPPPPPPPPHTFSPSHPPRPSLPASLVKLVADNRRKVGMLPFRRTSLTEEQQPHGVGQSGLHRPPPPPAPPAPRTETLSDPGFHPQLRARLQPRYAPLHRGSVSVKSDRENETKKGRIVAALLCHRIHNSRGITGPD